MHHALAVALVLSAAVIAPAPVIPERFGAAGQGASVLYVDFAAPPPTLESFLSDAAAVVHAVVKSTSQPIKDPSSSPLAPRAVRLQTLRLLAVVKDDRDRPLRSEVVVKQYGGSLIIEGKEYRTAYPATVFNPGEEFVLFLKRSAQSSEYTVSAASAGAFKVDPATLHVRVPEEIRKAMPAFSAKASVDLGEFLSTVRSIRSSQR